MKAGIRSDMKDMEAGIRFDMNKRFDEVDKRVNQIDCLLKKELPGINEEHKYTVNNIAEVKDDIKIICEFIGIKKTKVNNITSVV